ncbi:MAG TPA: TfpX/TfpZ family type IV pilin accessory protein [Burkholderiales bacterium]|nr:TfpX/TfpZ family type IV pilin accessory protein [Burkholderiales bacterium]
MDKSDGTTWEATQQADSAARALKRPMSRWRAAGIHLLISLGIAAVVLALMLGVWYGPTLFQAMGGAGLALIVIGVDVVLGPALTLVVFRSGKRGLKFDLAAIALLQLVALLYGCYVVSLARPAFIVFVKDQFQVATVAELESQYLAEARYPEYRSAPWSGPELVYGEWPKNPEEQQQLMFSGLAGVDLQHFPRYYAPYLQGKDQILAKAQPLPSVRDTEPQAAQVIDGWVARSGVDGQNLRYLRLRGRNAWVAVLIDSRTAEPVKMLVTEKF